MNNFGKPSEAEKVTWRAEFKEWLESKPPEFLTKDQPRELKMTFSRVDSQAK